MWVGRGVVGDTRMAKRYVVHFVVQGAGACGKVGWVVEAGGRDGGEGEVISGSEDWAILLVVKG